MPCVRTLTGAVPAANAWPSATGFHALIQCFPWYWRPLLFTSFDDGEPLVQNVVDKVRARRYKTLADALFNNPDLRFPNLYAVLPLPPEYARHAQACCRRLKTDPLGSEFNRR